MSKLKMLKEGRTYGVKKVHDKLYQVIIVIDEFETESDAYDAMIKLVCNETVDAK